MVEILVSYVGILGIPGKEANWCEKYDPNRTIGELIRDMSQPRYRLGGQGKRIEILKFARGDVSKYNRADPYWSHATTLGQYSSAMGGPAGGYLELVYVVV